MKTTSLAPRHAALSACILALLAGTLSLPAHAQDPWVVQKWQADWGDNGDTASGDGTTGGVPMPVNPTIPGSSTTGSGTASFDPTTGQLKSSTELKTTLFGTGGWGKFSLTSANVMNLTDQLTVAADGFGFMKIMIQLSGTQSIEAHLSDNPIGYAATTVRSTVKFNAAVAGGESGSFQNELEKSFTGLGDGIYDVDESANVSHFMELIVPWDNGAPVTFNFDYFEFITFNVDGVDAEKLELGANNSFGHTLKMFANVYDDQMNLLDGVTVGSSKGIGYQNFGAVMAPVPEPSTYALMALGLLAVGAVSRRSRRRAPGLQASGR